MGTEEEGEALGHVAERLAVQFPWIDVQTIQSTVDRYHHGYDGRPIRDFIPVLVEREARDYLIRLPQQRASDDSMPGTDPGS